MRVSVSQFDPTVLGEGEGGHDFEIIGMYLVAKHVTSHIST